MKLVLSEFRNAAIPPTIAWVRFAMRISVAVLLWLIGFHTVAKILAVLAVVMVVGTVEVQVAKAIMAVRARGLS